MMVEAATWDDWSTSETRVIGADDKWHVALAPGEVKVLSLEQLDDLYRLSLVDTETKVWQNGMSEWQPLGVIAGIEPSALAAPPARALPKPPAPRSAPPRPLGRAPAPQESVYAQPIAFLPTQPAFVPPAVNQFPSVRPLAVSQPPRPVASGGGGFGRFLIGLALIAGVSVTLYRNDVVRDAAHSWHQDRLYTRLQASLGGPAFGTLAALEQRTAPEVREPQGVPASQASTPAPVPVPATIASAPPVIALEAIKAETAGRSRPSAVASQPTPAMGLKPAEAAAKHPAVAAAGPSFKAALAKAEPVAKPAPVQKKPPEKADADKTPLERLNAAISASVASSAGASKKASKSKANEYDPLNPTL